ncbi:zinc finger protein 408 [Oncorhynchus tshawytscha]|uniref:C2H2-type domain-containing protein n=1 Tax=Oncorhynchus tshawytscha TaxID=74940 RepID=A0AAZ3SVY4_ONCTS|nr:zinc finger protein 408 [Oncorhynchus tshawytscha]
MMAPDLFNTRERRYTCDQCDKSFFQLYHLKKHKFTHLDLKPYLCTECGRNYSSQENFRAHLLMHKGERPFKCQQRDKSYGLKRDLKEHEVLHTGERPFVCDICGKAFARWPSVFIGRPTTLRKKITTLLSSSALSAVTNWPIQAPLGITCACTQENGLMPVSTAIRHSDSGGTFWGIYTSTQGKSLTSATIAISTSHRCLNSADTSYHTQGKSTSALYVAKPCGTPTPCGPTNVYTQGRDLTQCELCGKAYTMATKLRCHMKSHLEEKSYKCPTCGAGYTLMQSQFSHQKREDRTSGELANAPAALESSHSAYARGRPRKTPRKTEVKPWVDVPDENIESQTVVYVQAIEDLSNSGEVIVSTCDSYHDSDISPVVIEEGLEQDVGQFQLNENIIEIIVSD